MSSRSSLDHGPLDRDYVAPQLSLTPATPDTSDKLRHDIGDPSPASQIFESGLDRPDDLRTRYLQPTHQNPEGKAEEYKVGDLGDLEDTLGLAELMDGQDQDVDSVTVTGEYEGKKVEISGRRAPGTRGAFYTEHGDYVAVHSGYTVRINHRRSPQEVAAEYLQFHQTRERILANREIQNIIQTKNISDQERDIMIYRASSFGIDPALLFSMKALGVPGYSFGMEGSGVESFTGQVEMACRMIQRHAHLYERTYHGKVYTDSSHPDAGFEPGFLVYLSHIYVNETSHASDTLDGGHYARDILGRYSAITGKSYDIELLVRAQDTMMAAANQTFERDSFISGSAGVEAFIDQAKRHLGRRYVWGGRGVGGPGVDCSGLVITAMRSLGIVPPSYDSTAAGIARTTHMKSPHEVKRGDFVFLQNASGHVTHIEIAEGPAVNGSIPILHASSSHGQVIEAHQTIGKNVLVGTPEYIK